MQRSSVVLFLIKEIDKITNQHNKQVKKIQQLNDNKYIAASRMQPQ